MKIKTIDIPAAGTWARDCELISLIYDIKIGFVLTYHKDTDDTYWSLKCELSPAYKVVGEEFARVGYLENLPMEGGFFEIINSPWINELAQFESNIPKDCKHYVLQFYDETVEILAARFIFEQLDEKPVLN